MLGCKSIFSALNCCVSLVTLGATAQREGEGMEGGAAAIRVDDVFAELLDSTVELVELLFEGAFGGTAHRFVEGSSDREEEAA
ncbi:hypothetical protein G6F68_020739 [Rhizopus microsporus]|nr:hypothetical protein G6F68_020739 [Rhizopus microsporus]